MDLFLFFISFIGLVISLIASPIWIPMLFDKNTYRYWYYYWRAWVFPLIFVTCAFLLPWIHRAENIHNSNQHNIHITYHEILKNKDTVYYFDRDNLPRTITGNGRFADSGSTVIKITTIDSGWTMGIYVVGSYDNTMVSRPTIENNF